MYQEIKKFVLPLDFITFGMFKDRIGVEYKLTSTRIRFIDLQMQSMTQSASVSWPNWPPQLGGWCNLHG